MQKTSKSGLFLLEMIIIIVFFAATSAICVRLFVYAAQRSDQSSALTAAVLQAQSAAEAVKAADGDAEQLQTLLHGRWDNGVFQIMFDQDFQPLAGAGDAVYSLTVTQTVDENGLLLSLIHI